ncbi:MAG: SDR family oxidoreductase [Armatimonadota bacterium]|nr:MAG: SDR family oxidoreductase [Armatimonadota bacterium]
MAETPFNDEVCVITGASSGIGEELAYQLADQGARLSLAARSADKLNAVAAECARRGGKAIAVPTDVADEAQCRHLIEQTVEAHGRIDMLVNNAGFSVRAPFETLPDLRGFEDVMAVNFMGSVYCTYHALPHLKASGGRIVAVSSLAGRVPIPLNTAYGASKYAMTGFFETLRVELADDGVTVTIVYPDFVVSGFIAHTRRASGELMGEEAARKFYTDRMMSAQQCATIMLKAAAARRREVTTSLRGRLVGWMKLLAPGRLDRITRRTFSRR